MIYRKPRVILWQRYFNRRAKRVEILEDVTGQHMITDHQMVHKDYFNEFYDIHKDAGCRVKNIATSK